MAKYDFVQRVLEFIRNHSSFLLKIFVYILDCNVSSLFMSHRLGDSSLIYCYYYYLFLF